MKKIAMIVVLAAACLSVTGCGAFRNSFSKAVKGLGCGDYKVTVWSGGVVAKEYFVSNGYVNSEESSDGWYFTINGQLVRVVGTITIEQQ